MKAYYAPAVASALIAIVMLTSIAPAAATYPSSIRVNIKLTAEDDQVRRTGIMVLGSSGEPGGWPFLYSAGWDYFAQYQLVIDFQGIPTAPDYFLCQVLKMDMVNPPILPPGTRQFSSESLKTKLTDATMNVVCKLRSISAGVGVLDLYWTGGLSNDNIADYMIVISAGLKIGKVTIWGTDSVDLCVLGFSMDSNVYAFTMPDGTVRYTWVNPMSGFFSCQDAVWWQRRYYHVPIPTA